MTMSGRHRVSEKHHGGASVDSFIVGVSMRLTLEKPVEFLGSHFIASFLFLFVLWRFVYTGGGLKCLWENF